MRFLKNVFSQLHSFILWLMFSAVFWGWIFTIVTDAPAEEKVTVYCYVSEIRDKDLAVALEENRPEGIRMIKVHPFDYVMMNIERMEDGDIFILPESQIETYEELLADKDSGGAIANGKDSGGSIAGDANNGDMSDSMDGNGAESIDTADGSADISDGFLIYDAAAGSGGAAQYIGYEGEDYYLFLGARSAHLEDGKALEVARRLLDME